MTGNEALKAALDTEVAVTLSIKKITKNCESWVDENNLGDYHVSITKYLCIFKHELIMFVQFSNFCEFENLRFICRIYSFRIY